MFLSDWGREAQQGGQSVVDSGHLGSVVPQSAAQEMSGHKSGWNKSSGLRKLTAGWENKLPGFNIFIWQTREVVKQQQEKSRMWTISRLLFRCLDASFLLHQKLRLPPFVVCWDAAAPARFCLLLEGPGPALRWFLCRSSHLSECSTFIKGGKINNFCQHHLSFSLLTLPQ